MQDLSNSKDKPLVRQLYCNLKERSIRPWLDEEEIAPGTRFQDEIQQAIGQIKSAAVCIGKSGMGRWQALELETFIRRCIEADIRVIPVLLPGVDHIPENLLFLANFHAVTFETDINDPKALFGLEWGITLQKPPESRQSSTTTEKPLTAPMYIDADDLSSEKDIDYTRLRDLLKEGKWRDADQETYEVMIRAVGKEPGGWFTSDELRNFPCADLKTIDGLWTKYSNGHFGFSVQKVIWQKHGGPTSPGKKWDQFCVEVGWQLADASRYLESDELKADPKFSPRGEFPVWVWFSLGLGSWSFGRVAGVVLLCSFLSHPDL